VSRPSAGCGALLLVAIEHINVGVATLLNYTAPLFSGMFSILFLREHISPKVLIPMPIALAGVSSHAHARPGDILADTGARRSAVPCLRHRGHGDARHASGRELVARLHELRLLGTLLTAPLAIGQENPTSEEWWSLAATSIFAIGAQLLLTFSLRWVDAMTVGVISQLVVVVAMLLGITLLDEHLSTLAVVGAAVTIGGVVGVVYVTSWTKRTVIAADSLP
jgi:drug/metabolite transporter (DMT)-like permease